MKIKYTHFDLLVWAKTLEIKKGELKTYSQIAKEINRPGAARAVGNSLERNPLPIIVPCHRVIKKNGYIGNFSAGGQKVKKKLLEKEGIKVGENGRIIK